MAGYGEARSAGYRSVSSPRVGVGYRLHFHS